MSAPVAGSAPPVAGPAAAEPPPPVRGERLLRRIDDRLAWIDGWLGRWLPPEFNLLAQAGAAANVALLVAVGSGVLLLIWYSPSVQFAYDSLAAIPGRTLGGWVRALHRYSSDLTMLLLLVHAGRVFVARKFSGARWLPWVSGVLMLALVWFIGWTGYWLVWDQPAQQVAVTSMRLLDALPVFGEPMGRLYVSDRTVPSLLFFVIFFVHMLLPLAIAVGLAIHLARLSRVHLLPHRGLSWAMVGALAIASLAVPAPLDARAEMAAKAETLTVDAWYLSPLALALRFQSAGLWVALLGGVALGGLVPWLLGRRRAPAAYQAEVTPERCHACTQCSQDCPFEAISMVPRTDGKRFDSQAWVDPARCTGCGVCGGSCDTSSISLTWFDTRVEESRIERAVADGLASGREPAVALVAAEVPGEGAALLTGFQVFRVPTASWVRSSLVERLGELGVKAVLIVRDARGEAWARDGGRWVSARLAGERSPRMRPARAGDTAWLVVDFDPARRSQLTRAAEALRRGETTRRRRPTAATIATATLTVTLAATALSVLPSHLEVRNPTAAEPEFVVSFKAFGAMQAVDPPAEPADDHRPVHMRGRVTAKPQRAPVTVRVTIDGRREERTFAAKGFSRDGPAVGEWRQPWPAGEHEVEVAILMGGNQPPAVWRGQIRAEPRRLQVIAYEPGEGFFVE